ncbi:MAG: M56 family metallopeptidase [Gemmatimonadaceae bacterium]
MLCILYVNLVGACLVAAGLLIERALPAAWPRRWLWFAIIPVSMFVPGYYRYHHNWSIVAALEDQTPHLSLGETLGGPWSRVLDPDWWMHTESYDTAIHQFWLVASAMLVAWALANVWRVSRIMRLSRRQNERHETAIIDGVPALLTDVIGPATVGLWHSRVLVPRWVLALPKTERQYVLRHEEEHRTSRDGLLLFFASLPLILMPWNVALWWLLRRLCLAVEMDCDRRVVGTLGDAHAYGELLLKVAEAGNRGLRLQPAFLGIGMLERRLTQLLAPTQLRSLQRLVVPALALALLVLVAWMPHPVSGHASHAANATSGAITTHSDTH